MILEIINDPGSLIILGVMLVVVLGLYFFGKRREVIKLILHFIDIAEEQFGPKEGVRKRWYVVAHIYALSPKIIKMFYDEGDINKLVQQVFVTTKHHLEKQLSADNLNQE